jgi:hypothetical protein
VIPNAVSDDAPDIEVVSFHDKAIGIFTVGRAQHRVTSHKRQVLDQGLLIDHADDDLACLGIDPFVDDQQITAENTCPLHTVAFHLHQVSARRPDVQELIE